ncbi:LysR family transcriptional regulator [Rhodobacteraceae bacterium NNCM2]|nr:LysR family transcriptional regulator [Coraliihabitans acroporae]
MTDRLEAMSILTAVVDAGSLSAGARQLRMPIATVSRRVAELEAALGTQLLIRSARGLSLTDTGAAYLAACRRILEDVTEAERIAAGEFREPRGLLVLTAPIVFGRLHVLPLIIEFLRAFPEVDIRLEQTDRPVSLHEDHVDAAIRIGQLPDSSLRAQRLGEIRRVTCASPGYLAERGRPVAPSDLAAHDCITFANLMAPDRWRFGSGADEQQVPIHSRLVVNTADAAIAAAIAGLGMAQVLSYQVADALSEGQLELVLEDIEPDPWPVNLVFRDGMVPQKLRAFMDFAAPRLKAVLQSPKTAPSRR